MKKAQIEPGLLSLFRLSNAFSLLVYGSELIGGMLGWNPYPFTPGPLLFAIQAVIILLYLYVDWLQRHLGHWYLPVGLLITSISGLAAQWIEIVWRIEHENLTESIGVNTSLFFLLFIPAIIITVQYGYRTMLVFVVVTAVVQILPTFLSRSYLSETFNEAIRGDMGARIVVYPIVGFFVAHLVTGQKKDRKTLTEKNVELTQYATTVERLAISHERNRLARELHDTLAHTLSAVAVQLEAHDAQLDTDPEGAKQTLKLARKMVRNGLEEARNAVQALRASPLEDLGFALAMRHLIDAMVERSALSIALDMPDDFDELSPEVEQSIYRITEEALNNTIQHANARQATVSLRRDRGEIHLKITDDGFGFDPETASSDGHYGLVGMHERALLCDGQLGIKSAPGKGTTVRLTIEE
jgi:signal transduction histidine kinase